MKIAIVVQRYGADINGGAEQHARYVAEHLARHVTVEVLTTCAHRDYISWKNEYPPGREVIHGIPVHRFPVAVERDPIEFGKWSKKVFSERHSLGDELAWLESEGPTSPALIEHIKAHEADYDFFIFFSFRYHHSYHGCRAVASKAILVPTAERDSALGLGIYPPIFRGVRAFMYNSLEERALIHGVSNNQSVPGVVVGVGSEIPERSNGGRFRQKFDMRDRFAIYVGRIDENKGCAELFNFFEHYSASLVDGMHLVLIGTPHIPIPKHPRIHHLGFLEDQDKYDAMAASEVLIMPSYLESLSMVALEAWAMGKPVLANAKCDVLQGQCLRSNAGLFYANYPEFAETMRAIDTTPTLQAALGRNGRTFFEKNYAWPVIEKKYVDMLNQLSKEPAPARMESAPGWFTRRRKSQPPADDVVKNLPVGAYREEQRTKKEEQKSARVEPRRDFRPSFDSRSGRAAAVPLAQGKPERRPDQQRPDQQRRPDQRSQQQRNQQQQQRQQQQSRPQQQQQQQRPPQAEGQQQGQRPQQGQRTEGDRGRDQRRGRGHRRGRRPGGGGGGGPR